MARPAVRYTYQHSRPVHKLPNAIQPNAENTQDGTESVNWQSYTFGKQKHVWQIDDSRLAEQPRQSIHLRQNCKVKSHKSAGVTRLPQQNNMKGQM